VGLFGIICEVTYRVQFTSLVSVITHYDKVRDQEVFRMFQLAVHAQEDAVAERLKLSSPASMVLGI